MINQKEYNQTQNYFSINDNTSSEENLSENLGKDYFSPNKNISLIEENLSKNDSFSFSSKNANKKNENKEDKIKSHNLQIILKELNSQLTKMNYCNIIQTNSIQRLDLSLSFLSSQIKTLRFLNKKRKAKIQKNLDKFKNKVI
jgi:hypothetical protein